ncbi:MAG: oxidoreductase [Candidatus Schekmanbacteria bacterium]|nr:MAG: oxidoreductase [Candidatus Schekmanbacteria bacterium]
MIKSKNEAIVSQNYVPTNCEILSITTLTPSEKLFKIKMPNGKELGHMPGQFVQVSIPGLTEAPISVASSPTRKGYFELAVRNAGTLTGALHKLDEGDYLGIRGPFGSCFDIEAMKGKNLLLISGGCGLAPMRSLIQYCEDNIDEFENVKILYGAKNPEQMLFKDEIRQWEESRHFNCLYTVDEIKSGDNYKGKVGLITKLIPPLNIDKNNTIAVIIGPPVMYKFVIAELMKKGINEEQIIVSLERYMRCGIGKCGHCVIEHKYCCIDGPVFWLKDVMELKGAL